MPSNANEVIYRQVTERIAEQLEKGTIPWTSGIVANGMPVNAATGRYYTGINVLILWVAAEIAGYQSPGWVTFKQAKDKGWRVPGGAKATQIVFMRKVTKNEGREDEKTYFLARLYSVFNVQQLLGVDSHDWAVPEAPECRTLVEHWEQQGMAIERSMGSQAYYDIVADQINMPSRRQYAEWSRYYATLYHEAVHWTGADARLGRRLMEQADDLELRAQEELTAELGAAFLCSLTGIDHIQMAAAYLKIWAARIRANPHAFVQAASAASKAVNYLLPAEIGAYVAD